jgi:hypothetical protein
MLGHNKLFLTITIVVYLTSLCVNWAFFGMSEPMSWVGKKHVFFLFKTKHTDFYFKQFFFCLKHVLNLVKKNMF